ncbi:PqqD family peptide modification chaperone [Streptomyces sp. NPDC050095]|uniref:PqqD family peptide modification chaperone n=1 Tax=unclassified Streptomyces TaxID=2593676 RepID=UPI003423CA14
MSEIRVRVDPEGHLHMVTDRPHQHFRCSPVCTAMWIALRHGDGDVSAAAHRLAALWDTDVENTRADLDIWIGELRDAGLVRNEPCASASCRCSVPTRPPL